jgi:transcriptional regulator with XRE-family HTH domain
MNGAPSVHALYRPHARLHSEFASFLKLLRKRISPDVHALGAHARLPARVGKRVTQEEVAEAIGVSREWYAVLESAATTRTSTGLLERLADALMATPEERATLFHLAIPEVWRVQPREDSIALLDAYSRMRSLSKRLWAATSVEEALTTGSEHITAWFENAVLVHTSRRRASGLWESQAGDEKQQRNDASKIIDTLEHHVLPTARDIDALYLYPQLANPGDTGTSELLTPRVQREALKLCARRRLTGFTFIKSRVRSRTGLVASFCIVHALGHSYTALDHAVLGAFAEFASVALS